MDGSFVGRQKIIQLNDYMDNLEHPGGIPAAAVIAEADDRLRRRRKRRVQGARPVEVSGEPRIRSG
jgi:hypothetical protein